jgi:hypothetical protein
MATISDVDRTMISNTINQNSNRFTAYELEQIHEIALKLYEIYKALIAREDNSGL